MQAISVGRQHCSITPCSPIPTTRQHVRSTLTPSNSWPTASENATWRNFFLSGAMELRTGNFGTAAQTTSASMLSQLTPEQIFDTFAINVNGPRAWDLDLALDVTFLDAETNYRLTLHNGVLVYRRAPADEATANATVKLANKLRLLAFAAGDNDSPGLEVSGDSNALPSLLAVLDRPDPNFNIVTP